MAVETKTPEAWVGLSPDESVWGRFVSYSRRNPQLMAGIGMLFALFLFSALGPFLVDTASARPLSGQPDTPPSLEYPLGTDTAGRNILAAMIVGTPITLRIGMRRHEPTAS